MHPNPSKIPAEFTNRDNFGNSDFFMVLINPIDDGQNPVMFIVTASGIQIDSKVSKLKAAGYMVDKYEKEMSYKGFALDNPAYEAASKVVSATTNIFFVPSITLFFLSLVTKCCQFIFFFSHRYTEVWKLFNIQYQFTLIKKNFLNTCRTHLIKGCPNFCFKK